MKAEEEIILSKMTELEEIILNKMAELNEEMSEALTMVMKGWESAHERLGYDYKVNILQKMILSKAMSFVFIDMFNKNGEHVKNVGQHVKNAIESRGAKLDYIIDIMLDKLNRAFEASPLEVANAAGVNIEDIKVKDFKDFYNETRY